MKKKEILERNRASSMRARAKRKAWIQQLERTVTNVNETNVALQMEIKVLRTEVAKLKTLLLAHKDCPVTKAMQKGIYIYIYKYNCSNFIIHLCIFYRKWYNTRPKNNICKFRRYN